MAITLDKIHEDMLGLKKEVELIKHMIEEDFELSDEAKKELKEARETPKERFTSQEEMEKEFL